jgi:hypothetical protein
MAASTRMKSKAIARAPAAVVDAPTPISSQRSFLQQEMMVNVPSSIPKTRTTTRTIMPCEFRVSKNGAIDTVVEVDVTVTDWVEV